MCSFGAHSCFDASGCAPKEHTHSHRSMSVLRRSTLMRPTNGCSEGAPIRANYMRGLQRSCNPLMLHTLLQSSNVCYAVGVLRRSTPTALCLCVLLRSTHKHPILPETLQLRCNVGVFAAKLQHVCSAVSCFVWISKMKSFS